ncbi:hypothetical protein HGRIS_000641 [Hohenbuehelia grisea]|uniref:Transmembrane protein n=1 Tax=Hohenbuehelia grisea TaxID=104357 RepID=A0ABR3JTK1_9AGAR
MVGIGAVLISVSSYSLVGQDNDHAQTVSGCHIGLSKSTGIRIAMAWEALLVYDTLLIILTIFKTYETTRRASNSALGGFWRRLWVGHGGLNILALVLRDGALYFIVMALANLANILTFYFAGSLLRGGLSTFASIISVTMMSRLMLNLHKSADVGIMSDMDRSRIDSAEMTSAYYDYDDNEMSTFDATRR